MATKRPRYIIIREGRDGFATWWSADLMETQRNGVDGVVGVITIGGNKRDNVEKLAREQWPDVTRVVYGKEDNNEW